MLIGYNLTRAKLALLIGFVSSAVRWICWIKQMLFELLAIIFCYDDKFNFNCHVSNDFSKFLIKTLMCRLENFVFGMKWKYYWPQSSQTRIYGLKSWVSLSSSFSRICEKVVGFEMVSLEAWYFVAKPRVFTKTSKYSFYFAEKWYFLKGILLRFHLCRRLEPVTLTYFSFSDSRII